MDIVVHKLNDYNSQKIAGRSEERVVSSAGKKMAMENAHSLQSAQTCSDIEYRYKVYGPFGLPPLPLPRPRPPLPPRPAPLPPPRPR